MTRSTKVVELLSVGLSQDENGVFGSTETAQKAWANPMTVGASSWAAARAAGLRADAQVQIRSCDYAGQEELRMDGVEYTVERASDTGEYTVLTMKRRLSND